MKELQSACFGPSQVLALGPHLPQRWPDSLSFLHPTHTLWLAPSASRGLREMTAASALGRLVVLGLASTHQMAKRASHFLKHLLYWEACTLWHHLIDFYDLEEAISQQSSQRRHEIRRRYGPAHEAFLGSCYLIFHTQFYGLKSPTVSLCPRWVVKERKVCTRIVDIKRDPKLIIWWQTWTSALSMCSDTRLFHVISGAPGRLTVPSRSPALPFPWVPCGGFLECRHRVCSAHCCPLVPEVVPGTQPSWAGRQRKLPTALWPHLSLSASFFVSHWMEISPGEATLSFYPSLTWLSGGFLRVGDDGIG